MKDREHRLAAGSASANHPEADRAPDRSAATARPRVTHRVGLTLGVHAEDDEDGTAGKIAEAFYERFAKAAQEIDGVLWLLPVADIKRKDD